MNTLENTKPNDEDFPPLGALPAVGIDSQTKQSAIRANSTLKLVHGESTSSDSVRTVDNSYGKFYKNVLRINTTAAGPQHRRSPSPRVRGPKYGTTKDYAIVVDSKKVIVCPNGKSRKPAAATTPTKNLRVLREQIATRLIDAGRGGTRMTIAAKRRSTQCIKRKKIWAAQRSVEPKVKMGKMVKF